MLQIASMKPSGPGKLEPYTAMEIMHWYANAQKVARKRPHPWDSAEVRAADHVRHGTYGKWGHRG